MGIHFFENYNETIYNDIISSLLANHCKSNNISFYLITENRDNQSLKRAYPKQVKRIELGAPEHEMQYLDKIFQVGISNVIIVNLSLSNWRTFNKWIEKSNIIELANQYQVGLYKWLLYNCDKWDKPPEKLYKISKAHKYFFNHVFAGFYWNSSDLKEIRKDQKSDIPNDLTKVKNLSIYKLKFRQLSYEVLNQIEEKEVCLARSEDIRRLNTSKLLNCRKFVKLAKAEIAQSQILETDWKNCQNQIQS